MSIDFSLELLKKAKTVAEERKQTTRIAFDKAKQDRDRVKSNVQPAIDLLNNESDGLYKIMKDSQKQANQAHESGDKGKEISMRTTAGTLRSVIYFINEERNKLINKINLSTYDLDRAKYDFIIAIKDCDEKRAKYNNAIKEIERKNIEIQERDLEIAKKAGVSDTYLDNIKVIFKPKTDTYDILFGGIGTPDGHGHGHYSIVHGTEIRRYREPSI